MSRLNVVVLLALAGVADAIYSWSSKECKDLMKEDNSMSGSCVPPRSIPKAHPLCNKCIYNEQCESKKCSAKKKQCFDWGKGCYCGNGLTANCTNCPSSLSVDPTKCKCEIADFPNNWVDCTDGSGGKLTVTTYTPKLSSTGGLASDDKFAVMIQCYHNKFRESNRLQPVEWDDNLARFSKEWSEKLCENGYCELAHSRKSDRGFSAGENLYAYWGGIPHYGIPDHAKAALEKWYGEIKDYFYKGEGEGYNECNQTGVIGHFTQVMWESSTTIGCGFALNAEKDGIVVSCNYQPPGNWAGRQAFGKDVFCKLKKWRENKRNYGKIQWCGAGKHRC